VSRIVIVSGPPACGKTTLAARLAADLSLPLIAKDGIKETLFEALGTGDVEWSKLLGRGSFALIWHMLEAELAAGRSTLVEGNFDAEYGNRQLARLAERFDLEALQIHCRAEVEVLYKRYAERASGRHPGHVDAERLAGLHELLDAERYLLSVPGRTIVLDTTSFDAFDYDGVRRAASAHLSRGAADAATRRRP